MGTHCGYNSHTRNARLWGPRTFHTLRHPGTVSCPYRQSNARYTAFNLSIRFSSPCSLQLSWPAFPVAITTPAWISKVISQPLVSPRKDRPSIPNCHFNWCRDAWNPQRISFYVLDETWFRYMASPNCPHFIRNTRHHKHLASAAIASLI